MTLLPHAPVAPRAVLGSVSRTIGLATRRPWLPAGETLRGRLFVGGQEPALGVPVLDTPGALDVRVRLGYAPGLSGSGPLVTSLAVRLDVDGRPADLLLSAPAGTRGTTRRRRGRAESGASLTSRTTYVAGRRPLLLGARMCGSETFELLCLEDGGVDGAAAGLEPGPEHAAWRSVADLRVSPYPVGEPPLLADPVAHPLPGTAVDEMGTGRAV